MVKLLQWLNAIFMILWRLKLEYWQGNHRLYCCTFITLTMWILLSMSVTNKYINENSLCHMVFIVLLAVMKNIPLTFEMPALYCKHLALPIEHGKCIWRDWDSNMGLLARRVLYHWAVSQVTQTHCLYFKHYCPLNTAHVSHQWESMETGHRKWAQFCVFF